VEEVEEVEEFYEVDDVDGVGVRVFERARCQLEVPVPE
jgi:hypothetical protein